MTPAPHLKDAQSARDLLKRAVRESGLSIEDIAAKAGIALRTAKVVFFGHLLTAKMRLRWEAALDRPIWSSPKDFARRKALAAWLGFNPFFLSRTALIARAAEKGIAFKGYQPSRLAMTDALFAAYAAAHLQKPGARNRSNPTGPRHPVNPQ